MAFVRKCAGYDSVTQGDIYFLLTTVEAISYVCITK